MGITQEPADRLVVVLRTLADAVLRTLAAAVLRTLAAAVLRTLEVAAAARWIKSASRPGRGEVQDDAAVEGAIAPPVPGGQTAVPARRVDRHVHAMNRER
jgi:hypothetical protein